MTYSPRFSSRSGNTALPTPHPSSSSVLLPSRPWLRTPVSLRWLASLLPPPSLPRSPFANSISCGEVLNTHTKKRGHRRWHESSPHRIKQSHAHTRPHTRTVKMSTHDTGRQKQSLVRATEKHNTLEPIDLAHRSYLRPPVLIIRKAGRKSHAPTTKENSYRSRGQKT